MIAVFLDRDGTIGGNGGGVHPFEFTLYDFAAQAIKQLNDNNLKVFLFTNQSRVGRGYFTETDLLKGFDMMKEELLNNGAYLDEVYYCPHSPDAGCDCHKPKIGMLLKAKEEHQLKLEDCYVVGDNGGSDMVAAHNAGAKMILVRSGWGVSSLNKFRYQWSEIDPHYIASDLCDAVNWILKDLKNDDSL